MTNPEILSEENKRKLNSLMMGVKTTQIFEFDCDLYHEIKPGDIAQEQNITPSQKQNLKQLRRNLIKATRNYNISLASEVKVFTTAKIELSSFGYQFNKSKAMYSCEYIWFCITRDKAKPHDLKYLAVSSTGKKVIEMNGDYFFDYLEKQATKYNTNNGLNSLHKEHIGLLEIKKSLLAHVEKFDLQEQLQTSHTLVKAHTNKI